MIEKDILYDDSGKEVQSDQFKEIMHGTMSKDDAEKFWQRQFGGERNVRFLTEDELRQRTRDCSEEQFCFDGALSSEIKDIQQLKLQNYQDLWMVKERLSFWLNSEKHQKLL